MLKMRTTIALLTAGGIIAATVMAPITQADRQTCTVTGGSQLNGLDTQCQSPGNVQIRSSPPSVSAPTSTDVPFIYHHSSHKR